MDYLESGGNGKHPLDADVIIMGGGPGGATLATYLAMHKINVLVLEREHHPRRHVGESLVPATTRVFKEIGFLDVMEQEGFVKKPGAAWTTWTSMNESSFVIRFSEHPQPGVDQDYTYHVNREKFDLLLLKHAASKGARILQGLRVEKVLLDERGYTCGVQALLGSRKLQLYSKIIVDATGRSTLLGNQLRLKVPDPLFNQFAIHGWFEGVDRGPADIADFIHIHFIPITRGWVWQIPIDEKVTSIGVVTDKAAFKEGVTSSSDGDFFMEHVKGNPVLAKRMQNARQVRSFVREADYSYSMKNLCGNGFLLVGDAARFVDPIFSSGVNIAMDSAKFGCEVILTALEKGDWSYEHFKPYEDKLKAGVKVWYEFIRLYYKLMHLFTQFTSKKEYRLELLSLLQGEVYDRNATRILDEMRRVIRVVEATPNHIWKPYLTDMVID